MKLSNILKRLDIFPNEAKIVVSDFTGQVNRPCCVRKDGGDKVVIDFVTESMANLGQENLSSLNMADFRDRLETIRNQDSEVVFSSYDGEEFGTHCLRMEGDEVCFDIDGIA